MTASAGRSSLSYVYVYSGFRIQLDSFATKHRIYRSNTEQNGNKNTPKKKNQEKKHQK